MITRTNQALSDVFDITPNIGEIIEHESNLTVPDVVKEKSQETDFEIARATMHNLLLRGQSSLENAILIANGSEEADSFNAVSHLIGKMTEASVKLMGLHETKAKIAAGQNAPARSIATTPEPSNTTITGPVVFVGSTSELAKSISDLRKLQNK